MSVHRSVFGMHRIDAATLSLCLKESRIRYSLGQALYLRIKKEGRLLVRL